MKKIIASILAAFFVFLSPISAYAATTESMMMFSSGSGSDEYAVQPLVLYDDDTFDFSTFYYLGDYGLDDFSIKSSVYNTTLQSNVRLTNSKWSSVYINASSATQYDNYIKIYYQFTDSNYGIFYPLLGLNFSAHGLIANLSYWTDTESDVRYRLADKKPVSAYYWYDSSGTDVYGKGSINLNNIKPDTYFDISFSIPKDSTETEKADNLYICLVYELPDYINPTHINYINLGIQGGGSFVYGSYISGSSSNSSSSDYNQNVEAELGNIQTGINNVINSVVQMANQAQQIGQQTVQAVTQMTQQLNTAIDQQRQDILNGLGLLGDDIGSSLTNVKTEITNMGSSITNKLESTTESITNKIESTTETITNTIETKVNQVTTAVEDVKESVTEVKQSILDLPNKIKDMLLGLIVPDSQTMADKYSEFSQLLEQKLGVIYQIPMMLFDFFDTIVNAATTPQSTLTLPAFRLPWIDGSQLTIWNSMEYKIIPDGLEVLSDLIRTVTSMTVVVLTFNSVKQAYERFLRS